MLKRSISVSVTGRGRNYESIDRYINEEIILNDHLLAIKNGNNFVIVSKIQKNSLTVCERNYQIYKENTKIGILVWEGWKHVLLTLAAVVLLMVLVLPINVMAASLSGREGLTKLV